MATRFQARVGALGLLYAYDSGNLNIRALADEMLEENRIRHKQKQFALDLFDGVISHLEALDTCIKLQLKEWDFSRLGKMERSILRLGAFEILYGGIDKPVAINEAILLAKTFGEDKSSKFVNGVLDAIKK